MDSTGSAPKAELTRLAIRLEKSLLARVDGYAAAVSAQVPGMTVTRSDAIRALLLRGLGAATVDKDAGDQGGAQS